MYKVLTMFVDMQDNNRLYCEGDVYPREGLAPKMERISELEGSKNALNTPIIAEVKASIPKKVKKSETDE